MWVLKVRKHIAATFEGILGYMQMGGSKTFNLEISILMLYLPLVMLALPRVLVFSAALNISRQEIINSHL